MEHGFKKTVVTSVVLLALATSPVTHAAEGDAVGDVIQINTHTAGDQALIWTVGNVAMDADGNFIAVWNDFSAYDGDRAGISMRRFNADGTALDSSDRTVNTSTVGNQAAGSVAAAPDGRFVVVYEDQNTSPHTIYARLYDAEGNAAGDPIQVNTGGSLNSNVDVAMAADGSFVVVWLASYTTDVVARRFSADGTALDAAEVAVNTTTPTFFEEPRIAMAPDGDYIIVWGNQDDIGNVDSLARRYSADGTAIESSDFIVNTTTDGNQGFPNVAMGIDGSFVVAWDEMTTNTGVYAKCFNAAGEVVKDEFPVIVDADYTGSNIGIPFVAMDAEGDFAITALDYGTSDGDYYGTYMQRYDSSGNAQYASPVNVGGPAGADGAGGIAMDADGDIVVAFTNESGDDGDGYGVFAQRYEGKGHTVDLSLVGSGDTYTLGGSLTYTFTVTNSGSGTAVGLKLEDVLPSGVSYSSFSSTDDWSCSDSSGAVTCTFPSLVSGASSSVDITVDTSGVTDSSINNTATITNGVTDANDTDNSDTISTGVTASSSSGSSGGGGGALGWLSLLLGGVGLSRRRQR